LNEIISDSRDSINEDLARKKFSLVGVDETPIWMGSPTFLSYYPRYVLAAIIFLTHFIFYRVAVTVYAEGKEGIFYTLLRIIDQLFDLIDVFAFIIVMLLIARINHFLNISTSNFKTTLFLLIIGLVPSIWYMTNVIDWILLLLGKEGLNIPEWFDTWFLALGIINTIIFLIYTLISQFSYSYLITEKNIFIKRKILFIYNSITIFSLDELANLKTQTSYFGKIMGYGNILPISKKDLEIQPKVKIERVGFQKVIHIIKLFISYKRVKKELHATPSECLFGIRKPMVVYELANELMDENNAEIEI
tara:strand:- start:516 stop:1430 length:915 start_codon:yes stop_codon:yes gene_type:complete